MTHASSSLAICQILIGESVVLRESWFFFFETYKYTKGKYTQKAFHPCVVCFLQRSTASAFCSCLTSMLSLSLTNALHLSVTFLELNVVPNFFC